MWTTCVSFGFVSFWIAEGETALGLQFQWNTTKPGRDPWMYRREFKKDGPAGLGAEGQRIHEGDTQHRTGEKQGRIIILNKKECFKKTLTASGPCTGWGSGTSARSPCGHLAKQTCFSRPCQGWVFSTKGELLPVPAQNTQFLSSRYHWMSISLCFVKGSVSNSNILFLFKHYFRKRGIPWKEKFQSKYSFSPFFFFFNCPAKYSNTILGREAVMTYFQNFWKKKDWWSLDR